LQVNFDPVSKTINLFEVAVPRGNGGYGSYGNGGYGSYGFGGYGSYGNGGYGSYGKGGYGKYGGYYL
jgi:hypothetical protein